MKKFVVFYLIFVSFLLSCSKETEVKEEQEIKVDKFEPLKNASIIYVIGNDILPYEYDSRDSYSNYHYYYKVSGLESYEDSINDSLRIINTDSIRYSAKVEVKKRPGYALDNREHLDRTYNGGPTFYLSDKSDQTSIYFYVSGGFNRSIAYVDFINDSLKLSNGFIGKISPYTFNFYIKQIVLEIEKEEYFSKFGNMVWESKGVERKILYELPQSHLSYMCLDYENLSLLAKKLNKSIITTELPFIFKFK